MMRHTSGRRGLRVALVEQHPRLRAELHSTPYGEDGVGIVAETGEWGQVVSLVRASAPDAVLIDVDWPHTSALETCRSLVRDAGMTRIMAMTSHSDDERLLRSALMAGARGYVFKSAGMREVIDVLHAVAGGAMVVGDTAAWLMGRVLRTSAQSVELEQPATLTRREREVLDLVARGYDNRQIAQVLTLADKTVRNQVSAIFGKLGANGRAQAWSLPGKQGSA